MRILLVAQTAPSDTSFGAAQRTSLLYRALSEHGCVDVLIVNEGEAFAARDGEQSGEVVARVTVKTAPWYARYRADAQTGQWARARLASHRYDVVVGRELATAGRFGHVFDVPLIADADDAYYRYAPSGPSASARGVSFAKTRARMLATRRALRRFTHVWFASARDQRRFAGTPSSVLPNVAPGVCEQPPAPGDAPTILFVGALWYRPNVDAVDWFITDCWPAVRRSVGNVRLRIVGAGPVAQRERWSRIPGVECAGFVADLAPEYRAAHFTIAPVRFGGGTQIKTLESLAYGRAAIVSGFVHAGYSGAFTDGSLIVADSAREMAAACIRLIGCPAEAARIASAGRAVVQERFGWPAFRSAVADGLLLAQGRSPAGSADDRATRSKSSASLTGLRR
jgi:glycosyltransferase involved in cell wall biosynthesis